MDSRFGDVWLYERIRERDFEQGFEINRTLREIRTLVVLFSYPRISTYMKTFNMSDYSELSMVRNNEELQTHKKKPSRTRLAGLL